MILLFIVLQYNKASLYLINGKKLLFLCYVKLRYVIKLINLLKNNFKILYLIHTHTNIFLNFFNSQLNEQKENYKDHY